MARPEEVGAEGSGLDDDDDDLVDLSFAGPEPVAPAAPWYLRLVDLGSAYLPLVLMAVLAAGTWWLVRNAPSVDAQRVTPALRHDADYVMNRFVIQRFAADGTLRTQIEGAQLRHFPDNDTLEIDDARIRAIGQNGAVTLATAQHALSNGDGSDVQLIGDAHVTRPAADQSETIEFRSEFLQAFRNIEQIQSDKPVVVTQGTSVIHAAGMRYDNLTRIVDFTGPMRASFTAVKKGAR